MTETNTSEMNKSETIKSGMNTSEMNTSDTAEIRALYQELIIDHATQPKNFRKPGNATRHAEGYNPLCGDKVEIYLTIENDKIIDICFQGKGCAISTASASLMTETLIGKSSEEAEILFQHFQAWMTQKDAPAPSGPKLIALSGVRTFPMRIKCATLAWHALHAALQQCDVAVSTE